MAIHDTKSSNLRTRGTGTQCDNEYHLVPFILVGVLCLLVNFVLAIAPASAQTIPTGVREFCVPREEAALQLEEKFEEKVIGRGLTPNGQAMFEVFVSEAGTWTVLASDPNGRSCVIAAGEAWQPMPSLMGDPAVSHPVPWTQVCLMRRA